MAEFDPYANQGGPAAEDADALAAAKQRADAHLAEADYSGVVPEPLGGSSAGSSHATERGDTRAGG